jgi:putative nucleotidyltransferase with HDIG domain
MDIPGDLLHPKHYHPLPPAALHLCRKTNAPPRLIAHLVLVHDAACEIVEQLSQEFPQITINKEAVLFGAATHDLGKTIDRNELGEPGIDHQRRGMELLVELGVPQEMARFAFTHGNWKSSESVGIEDLLVALADKCWRNKTDDRLQSAIVAMLADKSGKPAWECYTALDDIVEPLAHNADEKLAWQRSFPVD